MGLFGKRTEPEGSGVTNQASTPPVPYTIEDAIRLMRTLPVDQNLELVVRVIKGTLESLNVRLPTIIEDATRKEQTIQERIAALHAAITDLEKEIAKRRDEIGTLEKDLAETKRVRQHLELAEGTKASVPVPPVPGSHAPPPLPPPLPPPKPPPPQSPLQDPP